MPNTKHKSATIGKKGTVHGEPNVISLMGQSISVEQPVGHHHTEVPQVTAVREEDLEVEVEAEVEEEEEEGEEEAEDLITLTPDHLMLKGVATERMGCLQVD